MSDCVPPLGSDVVFALLAAGKSERFGGDKLAARLGNTTLLERAIAAVDQAKFTNKLLIVSRWRNVAEPEGWRRVVNEDAASGMASSICCALKHAGDANRFVLGLADMPFVPPDHLRNLARATGVVFTRQADGSNGAPAAFPKSEWHRLRDLSGDRGAGSLVWDGARSIDIGETERLQDIDTPSDLEQSAHRLATIDSSGNEM